MLGTFMYLRYATSSRDRLGGKSWEEKTTRMYLYVVLQENFLRANNLNKVPTSFLPASSTPSSLTTVLQLYVLVGKKHPKIR